MGSRHSLHGTSSGMMPDIAAGAFVHGWQVHDGAGPMQHTGQCGQLMYSSNGLLVVHSDAGHWVVPPTAVMWLAPGIAYRVRKAEAVQSHAITLGAIQCASLPAKSRLYRLTPLLRELVLTLDNAPASARPDASDAKFALLIELLESAGAWVDPTPSDALSTPTDPRVAHICDYVRNNLDAPKTLQEWAYELDVDPRTLHRLFVHEFGMPFVQWRQQARVLTALEWLAQGRPVMAVALDLGYQTQSAFTAMFRRKTGMTPTDWQEKRRVLQ